MIFFIKKLLNTKDGTYQCLVENSHYDFFATYMDQIIISQYLNQPIFIKSSTPTKACITDNLPEMEWGISWNKYFGKETKNTPPSTGVFASWYLGGGLPWRIK